MTRWLNRGPVNPYIQDIYWRAPRFIVVVFFGSNLLIHNHLITRNTAPSLSLSKSFFFCVSSKPWLLLKLYWVLNFSTLEYCISVQFLLNLMNDLIGFAEVLAGYFLYADTTMGIDVREHYSCSHTRIALLPLPTPLTNTSLMYYMHKRKTVP